MNIKETGVVRRIDELGRVVIPKSIRAVMRVEAGDPLELYEAGDCAIIRKYQADSKPPLFEELQRLHSEIADSGPQGRNYTNAQFNGLQAEIQRLRDEIEDQCARANVAQADAHLDKSPLKAVAAERFRQDMKWGQQNHEPQFWMGILMEEVGELAQAVNETVFDNGAAERAKGGYENMRAEAVQVAAVAVALVEYLDRRYGGNED